MFFLMYHVVPAADNPERETLGDGFAACWIVRRSIADADKAARRALRRDGWRVLERDTAKLIRRTDYEDGDDNLQYYEQARLDRTVFVIHESPRHPLYWVTAAVVNKQGPKATAHYFVCNGSPWVQDEHTYASSFWNGKRQRQALKAARQAIKVAGWAVTRIQAKRPCGFRDLPGEFADYYEEAEDRGACLVFVPEGVPDPTRQRKVPG